MTYDFNGCINQNDYDKTIKEIKKLIGHKVEKEKTGFGFNSDCTILFFKENGAMRFVAYEDMGYACKVGRITNQRMNLIMNTDYYQSDESNILLDTIPQ